jgi:hypothetical protein
MGSDVLPVEDDGSCRLDLWLFSFLVSAAQKHREF